MKKKLSAMKRRTSAILSAVALGMIAGFSQSFTL
jgi:hypothetical protein